jgi:hypothetical protein
MAAGEGLRRRIIRHWAAPPSRSIARPP